MQTTLVSQPPKLLDQIRNKLRVKRNAIRTEAQYLHWIKRYIFFHGKRHPKDMGAAQIEAFLTNLAVAGKVSASAQIAFRHHVALTRNSESTPQQAGLRQRVVRRKARCCLCIEKCLRKNYRDLTQSCLVKPISPFDRLRANALNRTGLRPDPNSYGTGTPVDVDVPVS